MPRALLITQCLQNDFLAPLARDEPLPNPLHVGWSESRRLLGEDPSRGPLAQVLERCLEIEDLEMIHVRDWHDPADPRQEAEMRHFGRHCVRGTPGAEFVAGLHQELVGHPRSHVVDSISLNDTLEGPLPDLLRRLAGPEVRVGVIGVWTDVKVHYLLYELKTRFALNHLAVCSALVASRDRRRHFEALDQMRQVLGVRVIDSPGEFLEWLGGRPDPLDLGARAEPTRPELEVAGSDPALASPGSPERRLIQHFFRDCSRVRLEPLGGGYSGSRVLRSRSWDRLGYEQAPFVIKLDSRQRIATERVHLEQVENILGANAPQIKEAVDLGEIAGLKFLYATMGRRPPLPLKRYLEELPPGQEGDQAALATLQEIFESLLWRLYGNSTLERFHLYDYYSFLPRYGENFLRRAEELYGRKLSPAPLEIAGLSLPSPLPFYQRLMEGRLADPPVETFASWIHGDLNLANLLLDGSGNFWMIDFYHTRYGHRLQDLAKLENDLKFILTPLADEEALAQALRLEEAVLATDEPPAAEPPALITRPALRRCWKLVALVRRWVARLAEGHPMDYYRLALLRYSAHTLGFVESDPRQKLHALGATGLTAARLLEGQP